MDIFEAGYTTEGDVVEVIVNNDPTSTIDCLILSIQEHTPNRTYEVELGVLDSTLDYTIIVEHSSNYHITLGESNQELAKLLQQKTRVKSLVGYKKGSFDDARAKYEAFLDFEVAGIVETTFKGLKTRNKYYGRE